MTYKSTLAAVSLVAIFLAPVSQSRAGLFDLLFNMDDFWDDMKKMNDFADKKGSNGNGSSGPNSGSSNQSSLSGSITQSGGNQVYDLVITNNTGSSVSGGSTVNTGGGLVLAYPAGFKESERFARCNAVSFTQNLFPIYKIGAAQAMPTNQRAEKFAVDLPSGVDLATQIVDCSSYITPQAPSLDSGTKYSIEGTSRFVCFSGSWVLAESTCIAKIVPTAATTTAASTTASSLCGSPQPTSCGSGTVAGYTTAPKECCCEAGISGAGYSWQACPANSGSTCGGLNYTCTSANTIQEGGSSK